MVHVALVGASTGFGLTLLHHFLASKKHQITLLSRGDKPSLRALGIDVKHVDYDDHNGLVDALQGVHTVISTMAAVRNYDPDNDAQVNVIHAAVEAGVKRFAPSEFAHGSYEGIDLYEFKKKPWETLQTSGLEYTRYTCGLFTNLLANGTPKMDQAEALAGLRPWNYIINMKAGNADLPAGGIKKASWTEINDVCRFVIASLDLESWPIESTMYGDNASWAEVIEMTERIRGGQMLIKNTSIEEMEELAKNPQLRFYNQGRIVIARGGFENDGALNKLCPQVKPATLEKCLKKWWAGVTIENPSWEENNAFANAKVLQTDATS